MSIVESEYYRASLSNADFERLSDCIYKGYGIKMPKGKKVMLESRLRTRLRARKITSFSEYCDLVLNSNDTEELVKMIDVVSTNKTDFFRENGHFNYLRNTVLPEFAQNELHRPLDIWSAASSSGEEVYSLAMTLEEFNASRNLINYSILGTDISTEILQKAIAAIYREDRAVDIPLILKRKYLMKSRDREKPSVRIIPELRKKVRFRRLNLMSPSYKVGMDFDIIFCRNVLIYFDRKTQEEVINKLCLNLRTGGYLFLGHSESITGLSVPLELLEPTIYRKI